MTVEVAAEAKRVCDASSVNSRQSVPATSLNKTDQKLEAST